MSAVAPELGLTTSRLGAFVLLGAAVPGAFAWLTGATIFVAAFASFGGGLFALATLVVTLRIVRVSVLEPLQESFRALDALKNDDKESFVPERGLPLIKTCIRKLNSVTASVADNSRLSQANLVSAEAAFDRIHAVIQSLSEGLVVVDFVGRIMLVNTTARDILSRDGKPPEGRQLAQLLTGPLLDAVAQGMERVCQGEAAGFANVRDKDRVYDVRVVRVQTGQMGDEVGNVIVLLDVTKMHEVSRLKDDLLSSISHELRTPLTNIMSFVEILGGLTPDQVDEWREFVDIVGSETGRLKALVDDVFLYGQVAQLTDLDLDDARVDAIELMQRVVASAQPEIDASGIQITVEAEAGDLHMRVDADLMGQAVERVLDNALKFSERDSVVRMTARLGKDHTVEMLIDDAGCGVPEEVRELVFERFNQGGNVMTDKPSGTGLGLSICRSIVERLGGAIHCEASPLGGARFRLVMPNGESESTRLSDAVAKSASS